MPSELRLMSSRLPRLSLVFSSALVFAACGKSTTSSESSAMGSGGSSAEDGGAAHGGSAQGDGGTSESTATGGENSSDTADSSTQGGMTQSVATDGSTGGTTNSTANSATTAGGENSTTGSAGDAGMTAEEMGCIASKGRQCLSNSETSFACPTDAPVPDTCSECYEQGVSQQGHAVNPCYVTLPNDQSCRYCCCEPTESGCEERPDDTGCVGLPNTPRLFVCVKPYQELSGCTLAFYSDLVDEYCCP